MSSPPRTPASRPTSHRRQPSSIDINRRSSGAAYSPVTPRSSHGFQDYGDVGGDGGGEGLGSLADELADAWDDGEEGDGYEEEDQPLAQSVNGDEPHLNGVNGVPRDSGVVLASSPEVEKTLSPARALRNSRHRRKESMYDGSDYGDDSDLETSEGISAGLEARMAAVESLARRGMEMNGSAADGVVGRVTEQLRDLGSQAGVESGATRLTTAHSALGSHLTHQTRTLTSLTSSLLSPLAITTGMLDPDTIDALLPLITTTLELLPQPPSEPLYALAQLTNQTRDLLHTLSYLSDSLHMSRQATGVATRRLKSVQAAVGEWRKEDEAREEGVRFIERGEWEKRLSEREAEKVCAGVVGGFEEVCGMWRARLCEGLGVASA
ncbi:uncharacterized protein BDZ99DRAFT_408906 [Mytilinidion resinicola]|uniref:Uncharacterized protein n=1 Tax=Mytilinidion resinicola TaxID=574789 RepID=A0A6A6Z1W7_9PEZI|nr:uncharacterized protein BDZ99DRAFT_408906 [Mytilinidion resinicola]KAF2815162.1 hypothetical protein BDZ99DRAFT_408906 [Mytilinidion resinicola]